MTVALGDVAVRARGLARHLLSRPDLERLARVSGGVALARALETLGYWPAPEEGGPSGSTEAVDATIELETGRRLDLLLRWLGERRTLFAAVFEEEERAALRVQLRGVAAGAAAASWRAWDAGLRRPRRARARLEQATDVAGLVDALRKLGSPYGEPLEAVLRSRGEDLLALEMALDRTFAGLALGGARRLGGRLLAWVREGIDLENAWAVTIGHAQSFLEGGLLLSREQHATIAGEPDARLRRRQLARVFARSTLTRVFEDPDVPLAFLEAHAVRVRIATERRAARFDPIGPSPILEFVMRLRAERADLRRINWGIAEGLPTASIVGQLVAER